MDAATLDQFSVFVTIVAEGSFAAAARRLNRAQSAITYAIQRLEEQSGIALFDRSTYRPALTEAGHALLPRARQIVTDVADFGLLARGIAKGLEAEVCFVMDPFAPTALVVETFTAFHAAFPMTQTRISIESMDAAAQALSDGWADLALMPDFMPLTNTLERTACGAVDLLPVAAPNHPLAGLRGEIEPERLRDHLQLVLSSRTSLQKGREFGVLAVNRWYLADLETKHAMLLAGLGWGSMPRHRVSADLNAGRLIELKPTRWEGSDQMPRLPFVVAHRKDRALGPAGRWLVRRLANI